MIEYIFTIDDDYEGKILSRLGDSNLSLVAKNIASNYLDDNFEDIDDAIDNGLKIAIFNKEKLLLGTFHVNVEYGLYFLANQI